MNEVDFFLDEISRWVSTQADIQALVLVGSYAKGSARKDSDIDLILITKKPTDYLNTIVWAQQFGIIERTQIESYGLVTSLRVWYSNGLEVEYGITDERWVALPLDAGTQAVLAGGFRVLFERGNFLGRFPSAK